MPTLSIDDLTELLEKLTNHNVQENFERHKNGLSLRRYRICPGCSDIWSEEALNETEDKTLCSCWGI